MRILHFSDPHITLPLRHVPLLKWFGKRAIGGANLLLGRSNHFVDAKAKLQALTLFAENHKVDAVVCAGDYTALGLHYEYSEAADAVSGLMSGSWDYLNVPGNHDLYLKDSVKAKLFDTHFTKTLSSDLPEYQLDGPWPLVKFLDTELAVLAVNSAKPNPAPWKSSGRISETQLEAISDISKIEELQKRHVLILTHYAPLLGDGNKDSYFHGLENSDAFLECCLKFDSATIHCGHKHELFRVMAPGTHLEIFCSGSATMKDREGFWLFDFKNRKLTATPARWNGVNYELQHGG